MNFCVMKPSNCSFLFWGVLENMLYHSYRIYNGSFLKIIRRIFSENAVDLFCFRFRIKRIDNFIWIYLMFSNCKLFYELLVLSFMIDIRCQDIFLSVIMSSSSIIGWYVCLYSLSYVSYGVSFQAMTYFVLISIITRRI